MTTWQIYLRVMSRRRAWLNGATILGTLVFFVALTAIGVGWKTQLAAYVLVIVWLLLSAFVITYISLKDREKAATEPIVIVALLVEETPTDEVPALTEEQAAQAAREPFTDGWTAAHPEEA